MKKIILLVLVFILALMPLTWAGQKPINVVATQTIFADLVKYVGGDKVKVSAIASPKFNVHFIAPKPSDVRKVSQADLYVNAGLDLEAWSDPLLEAAGNPRLFKGAEGNLDLSQGIPLLDVPEIALTRAQGDIHLFGNPHFHMDPRNAVGMVQIILAGLVKIDPDNETYYQNNTDQFLEKLDQKLKQWKDLCKNVNGQEIISYHADIAYLANFLGFKAEQFIESKPGIPPTPKHLVFLENYARTHQIKAIVLPSYYSKAEAEKLAARIGAKIVTIAQGAGEYPDTEDFFKFFDYNFHKISEAYK